MLRFDAAMAFTVADLATREYGVVVVTDSFSLAEPVVRAQRISGSVSCVAFFDTLLDPRWASVKVEKISLNSLIPGNGSSDFDWPADEAETEEE
jgi:hypothetical protein